MKHFFRRGTAGLSALVAAAAAVTLPVVTATPAAAATGYVLVGISGDSINTLSLGGGYTLSPPFSPHTHDYVVRCNSGTNQIPLQLGADPAETMTVGTNQQPSTVSGNAVTVTVAAVPNEAVVLYAPDASTGVTSQYWIRCLPPDFPALAVNPAGTASAEWSPGYYLTGNLTARNNGTHYAMILNGNGTPVWYQAGPNNGIYNLEVLPNGNLAWAAAAAGTTAYASFNLATQTLSQLPAAIPNTDEHDLFPLPNGDRMMLSSVVTSGHDLSTLGPGFATLFGPQTADSSQAQGNVVDCVAEEVNSQNQAVWTWDANQHIGLDEINTATGSPDQGPPWILAGGPAADIYHCNSIGVDEDPSSPTYGDVLVSMRHTNAVYLIDRQSGNVVWKLGGTALTASDPEEQQATPAV
ncbi:MAG TPA: aryl-sulfate sulfotransferase [Mycobacterium sp.]|nr:aryl-sulfate sulfotransferase [Mycobacterium sp.]